MHVQIIYGTLECAGQICQHKYYRSSRESVKRKT